MKARSYEIRTYGCQMNVHDSERLAGLLEAAGYERADAAGDAADLVVFNTCAVRENADNRLYGNLGHLYPAKAANPDMQIAVGGCLAQKDRGRIVEKAPWVDVVFGTHNLAALPVLLERARHNRAAAGRDRRGAAELPVRPADPARLRAQRLGVDLGRLRQHLHVLHRPVAARRRDRPPPRRRAGRDPRAGRGRRRRDHAARAERQLLRPLVRRPVRVRQAAAGLRRDRRSGAGPVHQPAPARLHRRRHRRDGRRRPNVMPQLHMPMQSGSDAVLKAMRRSYRRERYLGHHRRGARGHARRRDHHRHHRRVPGRDRGRLRADAGRGARGPLRQRVHLPVLEAPRHAGRRHGRPGAEGGRAGALRAADRACRTSISLGRRAGAGRPRGRGAGQRGRRTQGRRHRPGLRARPRRAAGARRRVGRARATSSPPRSPTPRRTTWWPTPASATHRPWRGRRPQPTPRRGAGAALLTIGAGPRS